MTNDSRLCREVGDSVDRILASGAFGEKSRLRELLRYIVGEELEGRGDRLKAYAIGVDVFGRPESFNPNDDSIVRVEMNRLRHALDVYYADIGATDPVRIVIAKGTYRPRFETVSGDTLTPPQWFMRGLRRLPARLGHVSAPQLLGLVAIAAVVAAVWLAANRDSPPQPGPAGPAERRITVFVEPFRNVAISDKAAYVAEVLSDQIVSALTRNKALSVFRGRPKTSGDAGPQDRPNTPAGQQSGIVVSGSLQSGTGTYRVMVELTDAKTRSVIWAQSYQREGRTFAVIQDELAATIASELRLQIYGAARRALPVGQSDVIAPWQLYVQANWTAGQAANSLKEMKERVAYVRRALERDPDFGQAHAVLAEKLAYLANIDPSSDTAENREEAEYHARRALELAPDDPDTVFNVGVYFWHAGKIDEGMRSFRRTYELDPNHVLARLLVRSRAYVCSEPPPSVVEAAIAYDRNLSPANPLRGAVLYWIAMLQLNRGEPDKALANARDSLQVFSPPPVIFQLAAILTRLGRTDEALELIDSQRTSWPTLDPRHFASTAIPRRCGDRPRALYIQKLYDDLAEAYENRERPERE